MTIRNLMLRAKALSETGGQELIEYALMAGFLVMTAGALMPGISNGVSTVFSQIASVMTDAAAQDGSSRGYVQ
jgi:pilus assembly protein Flp/PilA